MVIFMKKRILCLDGGGVKGLFSAQFLAEIEQLLNCRISDYFDIIAGTSTGAIIAAGLAVGIPASEICHLYIKHAAEIFPQDKRIYRLLKRFNGARYNNNALKECLSETFHDSTIGECKTRLLVPSYNLSTGKVQVFKTAHADDLYFDHTRKIVDVLLATTAAPTYLPPYKTATGTYIDGGIGANNPSVIAMTEAVSRCGWDKKDIYLLSLGCIQTADHSITGNEKMGFLDVSKLIDLFMDAEMQYNDNIIRILLNSNQYLRINPFDSSNRVSIDNSKRYALNYLQVMAKAQAQQYFELVQKMFFDIIKEPFIPSH